MFFRSNVLAESNDTFCEFLYAFCRFPTNLNLVCYWKITNKIKGANVKCFKFKFSY